MKRLLSNGIKFVKENQTMVSSLLLIFVVVGALFLNSYVTLNRFQENMDRTLRGKAVMAENIIEVAALQYLSGPSLDINALKEKLGKIKQEDDEITSLQLFVKSDQGEQYVSVFGGEGDAFGGEQEKIISENAKKFALSVDDAFAFLSSEDGIRHWNVVKSIKDESGQNLGILSMKLSLEENDELVKKTIFRVYLLSIGAVVIVLLLILNHMRLFSYEVKAKKLEEIDKMKDDFISMASHELKAPLTAISGYMELLSDSMKEAKKDRMILTDKYISNINISVKRLKELVEDLLDVSRIEQNRIPIEIKDIPLKSLVNEMSEGILVSAEQKGIELINNFNIRSSAMADPERVKQIVVNLLSNAIKYTPKGKVEIQGKEDDQWIYLTVADTGLGISSENMKNLFSKFFRVRNRETADITGTGLGLWIAREIAQKMEGDLTVESIEGVGSHFTLKLKKT